MGSAFSPLFGVFECIGNGKSGVASCFTRDSYTMSVGLAISWIIFTTIASIITRNYSWVDRSWSIFPVVISWIAILYSKNGWSLPTTVSPALLMTLVITLWGLRLSYNFYRKGGYSKGGEDYRWTYVRSWPIMQNPIVWGLFFVFFINIYQLSLIWSFTVPVLQLPANKPACLTSYFFAGLFLVFLAIESIADQQQWDFHQAKFKKVPCPPELTADCKRGFLTHGLWSWSRHPNVFGEVMMWVVVFLSSIPHVGFTTSFLGAVLLIALIIPSARLTETISSPKYPQYKNYQRTTPFLFPTGTDTRLLIDRTLKDE